MWKNWRFHFVNRVMKNAFLLKKSYNFSQEIQKMSEESFDCGSLIRSFEKCAKKSLIFFWLYFRKITKSKNKKKVRISQGILKLLMKNYVALIKIKKKKNVKIFIIYFQLIFLNGKLNWKLNFFDRVIKLKNFRTIFIVFIV